jgi:hypothetical protein
MAAPERCRAPGRRGPLWCSGGGVDEGAMAVASKRSWHGGDSGGKGVPAWWRQWRQQGPDGGSMCSSRYLDGSPAAAACEENKIL